MAMDAYNDEGVGVNTDRRTGGQAGGDRKRSGKGGFLGTGINANPLAPIKKQKDMLRSDLARMENDPGSFGLSEAERRQMIGEQQRQANAAQQAQQSNLARTALGGQGFQQGGFTEAASDIAASGAEATAQASANVQDLNQAMIDKELTRVRGELAEAADRKRANDAFWRDRGIALGMMMMGSPQMAQALTSAGEKQETETDGDDGDTPVDQEDVFPGGLPDGGPAGGSGA